MNIKFLSSQIPPFRLSAAPTFLVHALQSKPMDPNDGGLNSFYHHHPGGAAASSAAEGAPLLFPHSVSGRPSAAPAPVSTEPVRRKRGRPRKYGPSPSAPTTPAKNASGSALPSHDPSSRKKETASAKKAQLSALGNAGQGFTPHVITIAAGEDVAEKIMSFKRQCKQTVCILSASGSISNASLRQPAMLESNINYEGSFEILSLSGSFMHTEATAGASSRTDGMSVCLSGADGRIVGGGIGGPLIAAGPVQVIVGSFFINMDRNFSASTKVNVSSKLQSSVPSGTTIFSPLTFRSTAESLGRITGSRGGDDHQSAGGSGSNDILQSRSIHAMPSRLPTDWRMGRHDSEHSGGGCLSPEPEDGYDDIQD